MQHQKRTPTKGKLAGASFCFSEQEDSAKNRPESQGFCKDCSHFKCTELDQGKSLRLECSLFDKHAEPYDIACFFYNAQFDLTCELCAYLRIIPRLRKDKVFCYLDGEKATITQRACHNFSEVMAYA